MKKSYKISRQVYNKRFFDPASIEDLVAVKSFLKHGTWDTGCPFALDWPHTNLPDQIKTQIVEYWLDKVIAEQRRKNALVKK